MEPALAELAAVVPAAAAPSPPVPVPPAVDADRLPPPAPPGLVARAFTSGLGISGPLELAAAPVHLSPAIPAPVVAPLPELAPPVTLGPPADDLRSLLPELEPSAAPGPVAAVQTVTGRTAEGPWVSLLPAAVAAGLTAGALGGCRRRRGPS